MAVPLMTVHSVTAGRDARGPGCCAELGTRGYADVVEAAACRRDRGKKTHREHADTLQHTGIIAAKPAASAVAGSCETEAQREYY